MKGICLDTLRFPLLITRGSEVTYEVHKKVGRHTDEYTIHKEGKPNSCRRTFSATDVRHYLNNKWEIVQQSYGLKAPSALKPLGEVAVSNLCQELCLPSATTKENLMHLPDYKDKTIAKVTLVNGRDVATMTPEDFYGIIDRITSRIERLEKVSDKSEHIKREIKKHKDELEELVALMDATFTD